LASTLSAARDAGRDARTGVRDADHLEQLLHRAVLAVATVQRDECHVGSRRRQLGHQIRSDVNRHHVMAEALERILHASAGAQRNLALERAPALENATRIIRRVCAWRAA